MSQAINNSSQTIMNVAMAHPGPPNAGIPKPPKIKRVFRGILNRRPVTWIAMTILGRAMALFRVLYTRKPSEAGRENARMRRYSVAFSVISGDALAMARSVCGNLSNR